MSDTKYLTEKDKHRKQQPPEINPDLSFKPIGNSIKQEVDGIQSNLGILNALEALEIAYNEMKEQLVAGHQNAADTGLPATALVTEIRESLDEIQEIMHRNESIKKRRRQRKNTIKIAEEPGTDDDIKSQTIKDKRKAIKSRAVKVLKKKKTDAGEQMHNDAKTGSTPRKNIVDQKHFKKITLVQEIFEHNSTLSNVETELGLRKQSFEQEEPVAMLSMPDQEKNLEDESKNVQVEASNKDVKILGE